MRRSVLLLALVAGCSAAESGGPTTQSSENLALQRLEKETGARWQMMRLNDPGRPVHLEGRTAPVANLMQWLDAHREVLSMREPSRQLSVLREAKDELGMTHIRYTQVERGVPVVGAETYVHLRKDGSIATIDSMVVPSLETLDLVPSLTRSIASQIAKDDLAGASIESVEEGALVVFALNETAPTLAYEVAVRGETADGEPLYMRYTIDAKTGRVVDKYNDIQTIEGSGVGASGVTHKIEVTQSGGGYTMVDTLRTPNGIRTYTANQAQTLPGTIVSSTTLTAWDNTAAGRGAAVDAHAHAGLTYDYYKKVLGRDGINGANGAITSTVHFGRAYNNAFWDGRQMAYGDGDGTRFKAFSASLDVVAHELSHGVTTSTSNLRYQNQSGALNESFSDVMGSLVEIYAQPNAQKNWKMGDGIALGNAGLRDMIDPTLHQQPSHMSRYVNTTQDNGGVHINSGIPNQAMYLMTMGGTNKVSNVQVKAGIGAEQAGKIWYRLNTNYLTTTSGFQQAATGTLSAVKDLNLGDRTAAIVECAWIAVGVLTGTCKPIADNPNPPPAGNDGGVTPGTDGGTGGGDPLDPPTPGTGNGGDKGNEADPGDDSSEDESTPKKKKSVSSSSGCSAGGPLSGDAFAYAIGALGAALMLARRRRKQ